MLITQPPVLPVEGTREHIRQFGIRPIKEVADIATRRHNAQKILRSYVSDRVHLIDVEDLFITPSGEVRILNNKHEQLYHDATHLSGAGAALVRQRLENKIAELLQMSKTSK